MDTIGIEKYNIKCNTKVKSNDCNNSTCIFSLKNLEIFVEYLKNAFKSFSKEDIENIRIFIKW